MTSLALGILDLLPKDCAPPFRASTVNDTGIEGGCIMDRAGQIVMVIDPERERFSDEAAINIAHAFCLAINAILGEDTPPLA